MAKDKTKDKKKNKSTDKSKSTESKEPLQIRISEDAKAFSFKVATKELETAIGKVSAVLGAAGSNEKNFVMLAVKKRVVLVGYNPDTYVYLLIKTGEAESDGAFAFQAPTLVGIIKGRSEMSFEFKGGDCVFKDTKSRYAGTFHTQAVSSDQVNVVNAKFVKKAEKEEKNVDKAKRLHLHSPAPTVLPRTVLDCLKEGIALTSIKDIYTGKALLNYMQLNEKGILTISAFDGHHFGFYRVKVDAAGMTFRAALPSSHFMIIDRMVEGTEAKFHVQNENIRVEGEDFAMILPSIQTDPRNYEIIPNFVKQLKEPSFKAKYDHGRLSQLTDNLFSLHSVNSGFEITYNEKGSSLDVAFKTQNGSASDGLKCEVQVGKKTKAKIDPRLLRDIIGLFKTQDSTMISIVPASVVRIDAKTKLGASASLMTAQM